MTSPIRVLVWGENYHEKHDAIPQRIYPDTIHGTIAAGVRRVLGDDVVVETATLDDDEHGLTEERLARTDVLIWWGHVRHDDVADGSEPHDEIMLTLGAPVGHRLARKRKLLM